MICLAENDKVRIPVEFRFEYSDKRGKWVHRPYAVFGKDSEKIEIGAEFSPLTEDSEKYSWNFKIIGRRYAILFDGMPLLREKNHHIMLGRPVTDYIAFRLESQKTPWVRLP